MGTGTVWVPVPRIFHFSGGIGTGIGKNLVPEKSLGTGIGKIWEPEKVSEPVSEIYICIIWG